MLQSRQLSRIEQIHLVFIGVSGGFFLFCPCADSAGDRIADFFKAFGNANAGQSFSGAIKANSEIPDHEYVSETRQG